MTTISLKLPESLAAKLTATAQNMGMSKSALVRQVLEEYLANDKTAVSGSCLELAADLVGSLSGPGDLSFDKKHFRGFGK
jgi:predicted transcriptional regulator